MQFQLHSTQKEKIKHKKEKVTLKQSIIYNQHLTSLTHDISRSMKSEGLSIVWSLEGDSIEDPELNFSIFPFFSGWWWLFAWGFWRWLFCILLWELFKFDVEFERNQFRLIESTTFYNGMIESKVYKRKWRKTKHFWNWKSFLSIEINRILTYSNLIWVIWTSN